MFLAFASFARPWYAPYVWRRKEIALVLASVLGLFAYGGLLMATRAVTVAEIRQAVRRRPKPKLDADIPPDLL